MAPDCRSWIFPNSSNTKRKLTNLSGDLTYDAVVLGNLFANIAIFLMHIAVSRGVHFFIENPASSLIFRFAQDEFLKYYFVAKGLCNRCAYQNQPDGSRMFKMYKYIASGEWINQAMKKCGCARGHVALMDRDSQGRVTGNANLSVSAAYPLALGEDLTEAWSTASPVPTITRCTAPSQHSISALAAGSGSGIERFSFDASPWQEADHLTTAADGPTLGQPLAADNPWAEATSGDSPWGAATKKAKDKRPRTSATASSPWDSPAAADTPWAGTDIQSATSSDNGMSPWG
jgi:hypothetical protein